MRDCRRASESQFMISDDLDLVDPEVEALARAITEEDYRYGGGVILHNEPDLDKVDAHVAAKVESRWPERIEQAQSLLATLHRYNHTVIRLQGRLDLG
ncbi:hypothetical protein HOU02_gp413 [Caulobacter phage CcrBL9]|uniref:Uncharacterized protein n=1 Tax=Caulobacter phage CcrBL9 TaxID=2283270 RepID=A0A385EEM8_9CAUD|nr:hypothetical protein HOU02_gp413 [Caulobacter phage CcrBL9]AXQ69312.1 hypothetical protein CcrBL9_gp288 [Caulobacter phage CcrBL9]